MHDPRESFRPSPPVILDFDGSVLPVAEGERRIPLGSWQEAIRFGCTRRAFSALEAHLEGVLPVDCGCAFMGSGDFHHLSWLLIERCIAQGGYSPAKPLRVGARAHGAWPSSRTSWTIPTWVPPSAAPPPWVSTPSS